MPLGVPTTLGRTNLPSYPWYLFHIDASHLVMRIARIKICMSMLQVFRQTYFPPRKRQVVGLMHDGQVFARHGTHSFATSVQLHHFSSTRLRLSHSSRMRLAVYGN